MTEGTKLLATFQMLGELRAMSADWEENLLHIAQESLTNTIKHAQARTFRATLAFRSSEVELTLLDDGRGFDRGIEHPGFGLTGMKERVHRMGGHFVIRSIPDKGTQIQVILMTAPTV